MKNETQFEKELKSLINYHSLESESDTPDWILANYLKNCLINFNETVQQREKWYGRDIMLKVELNDFLPQDFKAELSKLPKKIKAKKKK